MEFYGKRTLYSFMSEQGNAMQPPKITLPSFRTFQEMNDQDHVQFSPPRHSTTRSTNKLNLIPPASPESPWTLSPLHTPSPSLLYHCIASIHRNEGNIFSIAVSKGVVFTGSESKRIRAWRQPDCIERGYLKASSGEVRAILAHGSSDGTINFWEKEKFSGRFNHGGFLQGHRFSVLCLVAVEKLIFSGSEDTTIRVWRREEGSYFHECLAVLDGHRGPVRCLAACMELEKVVMGFLVYSASLDHSFKIWRVKVLPEEKMCMDYTDQSESKARLMEYEMSPVLSPSWVERKLRVNPFQ
ncbi:protein JINGUBANG-like isoform X2 [Hevea brasiliensis]|uniref:protein JINGUBANG-like isoform X2 n=1 Tax=Hevea brasiliensis TaxID=3981 RepID=UPI0025CF96F1|nr:protein JINGUBANG-like isoform X2 [Hevea brasiliensis]